MLEVTETVVFLPPFNEQTDAKEIVSIVKGALKKYKLRPSELDVMCGYSRDSKQTTHVLWQPERFISKPYLKKLAQGLERLKREHRETVRVTFANGIREMPDEIRVNAKFPKCVGHKKHCLQVDKNGFCSDECKELFNAKKEQRK